MQVIDEVAKVPQEHARRQVPMISEMQKDQKPEEVQISFKVNVDLAKDGQNDTMSCMKGATHFVFTSKAGRTKPKRNNTITAADVSMPEEM